jgi:hypothetical protein
MMPPSRITGIIIGSAAARVAPTSCIMLARLRRNPTGPKK